jgi:hypothetical protein
MLPKEYGSWNLSIYDAMCSGQIPWSQAKTTFCKYMKMAMKIGLLTPALPGAASVLAALETLCPNEAPEADAVKTLVQGKSTDPKDVLAKVLNPTGAADLSGILDGLAKTAPQLTGNPYADLLTSIISNSSDKSGVITSVLDAMGISTGPGGEITPDNGQSFSPNELGMLAAGLVGAVIGYADYLTA